MLFPVLVDILHEKPTALDRGEGALSSPATLPFQDRGEQKLDNVSLFQCAERLADPFQWVELGRMSS